MFVCGPGDHALFILALLGAGPRGAAAVSGVVNGDFEEGIAGEAAPTGWQATGAIRRISPGALGQYAVRLAGRRAQPDAQLVQRVVIPASRPGVVTVAGLLQTRGQ